MTSRSQLLIPLAHAPVRVADLRPVGRNVEGIDLMAEVNQFEGN